MQLPLRRRAFARLFSTSKLPILFENREINGKTTKVEVFSWGRGTSGQLGGGIEENRMYPSPLAELCFSSTSQQPFVLTPSSGRFPQDQNSINSVRVGISCGLFHSGLVVDGRLWTWGKGDGGRLGLGDEHPSFLPTLVPFFDDHTITSFALGGVHSTALTSCGNLFTWGYGGFGALGHRVYHRELIPRKVKEPWSEKLVHVATSGAHTAAITESGEVYTWGRDEGEGRLGLGPERGPSEGGGLSIPSKVKALPHPAAAVCCGGFFTMALTEEGQIWNWGANSNYELGRGDRSGGWQPKRVDDLAGVRLIQIACGGYHSLALTEKGKVLTWGLGAFGQLGHGVLQNEKTPRPIEFFSDQRVVWIACGGSSSAAITEEGKLYMWGCSRDYQLGIPDLPHAQPSPAEVIFLQDSDDDRPFKAISVAIGASHAICLVQRST